MKYDPTIPKIGAKPLYIGAGAAYPYSPEIRHMFTIPYPFEDEDVNLWKPHNDYKEIWIPRRLCVHNGEGVPWLNHGVDINTMSKFVPRSDEQERIVKESTSLLLQGQSHILRAPTGFGKTIVGMEIAHRVGKKTLVLVTKGDLAEQWADAACKVLCEKVGIIQGDKVDIEPRIVVGSVQSLCKPGRYPDEVLEPFGLCIVDEVHRMGAPEFSNAMWHIPARLRLGMSATPYRGDHKDFVFHAHIGPTMVATQQEVMDFRVLVVGSGWSCPITNQGELVHHSPGKTTHIVKTMVHAQTRNHLIAHFARRAHEKGRTVLVFSELLKHLEVLRALTVKYGIPLDDTAMYVGGLSKKQRAEALTKRIIFATYKYCSEGTDIPHADTLVLGMPRSNVVQIVGRILREHEGKKVPVVLDVVDSHSPVFFEYAKKRMEWYTSRGADVRKLKRSAF